MATTKADSKKAPGRQAPARQAPPEVAPVTQPRPLEGDHAAALDETPLTLTAELGRSRITLDRALQVGDQSLIELDKAVGDPVDILINGRLYARGEVVTVSENFGVRIVEILRPA